VIWEQRHHPFRDEWVLFTSHRSGRQTTGRLLGLEVAEREGNSPRVIAENSRFLATLPWFARYAYEVLILPKRHRRSGL